MTVRLFCVVCQKSQPIIIEPMQSDDLNGDKIWGDIICSECKLVIATVEVQEPGIYDFVKVAP